MFGVGLAQKSRAFQVTQGLFIPDMIGAAQLCRLSGQKHQWPHLLHFYNFWQHSL